MISWFSFPTRVAFGQGALSVLPDLIKAHGSRPLIVTDPLLPTLPPFAMLLDVLTASGIEFSVFSGVQPNPTSANVIAGVAAYRSAQADCIIGIGGGSALDGAKGIQLMVTHAGSIFDYDDAIGGDKLITSDLPPLFALPTTAGTGSEVGRSTVITDVSTRTKKVIFSPYLMPTAAVIDLNLMRSLPPQLTASTGLDALAHNVEAYLSDGYHPLADALALEGIHLVGRSLKAAVDNGHDMTARRDMAMAAMIGATAFQKGLGVCHSLAHPLSTLANVHHGLANGVLLANVMRFNMEEVPERVAAIGRALDVETASAACDAVADLALSVGVPQSLTEIGVDAGLLDALADQAFADGCHQCNPRVCAHEDIVALYVLHF